MDIVALLAKERHPVPWTTLNELDCDHPIWRNPQHYCLSEEVPCSVRHLELWEECPVCLTDSGELKACVMLDCAHRVCGTCIGKLERCPLCRRAVTRRCVLAFQDAPDDQIWLSSNKRNYILQWLRENLGVVQLDQFLLSPKRDELSYLDTASNGQRHLFCIRGHSRAFFVEMCIPVLLDAMLLAVADAVAIDVLEAIGHYRWNLSKQETSGALQRLQQTCSVTERSVIRHLVDARAMDSCNSKD